MSRVDDVVLVAVHEAGHVVVATALGIPVREVWVRPRLLRAPRGRTVYGRVTGTADEAAAVAGAGIEAEAMHVAAGTGVSLSRARRTACRDSETDLAELAACLADPDAGLDRDGVWAWCHDLLCDHWPVVEAVAGALAASGRLSGRALDRVLSGGAR
ncbi:hypothetical protein [Actinosynnema sp. NPDC023587]|uniref:hypothetical protein n=1 Tax=Actinosynnema sp. NPDC023587 TaxID=3154695 RepID=UPI0033FFE072